jgi:DNA polymerase III subunit delta'
MMDSISAKPKTLPPWLTPLWDGLKFEDIPHAILLHGQAGVGKFGFALELAKALLCESPDHSARPCMQCEACHWFSTGNHPDFVALVPETHRKRLPFANFENDEAPKKGKSARDDVESEPSDKKEKKIIAIEETRSAIEGLSIGSHRGGNRVILVYPMEMLRSDSANTLLKSLEEPAPNTIFILLADRVDRVLPTIRSRCRLMMAPRPDREVGLAWLRAELSTIGEVNVNNAEIESIYDEQGGAPYAVMETLIARHQADEKDELGISVQAARYLLQGMSQGARINWLDTAEKIHKAQYAYLLATMQRWVSDLQSVTQGAEPRFYPKHLNKLEDLAHTVKALKLLSFWKALVQARRHENHPLASRVQLEALLLQYQQVFES